MPQQNQVKEVKSTQKTTCCVVGGGPAGAVLSYLLARQGIEVILLESHHDFDRDFRGDTLHPSIMEVLDEMGLAEDLLQLPHTKLSQMRVPTVSGQATIADLSRLKTKFPFITLMPQACFLDFITRQAQRFPSFKLVTGARVEEVIEEAEQVGGVRYQANDGWHEVHALLTVGADGRFSRLRKLGGFEALTSSPPLDVLWFRLPRKPTDPHGLMGRFGRGHLLVELEREEQWQVAFVIAKGSYQQIRQAGLASLRQAVVETAPEFENRIGELADWNQISVLSVEADRLKKWYKPGLLLIGDAAHVMSPVGGNGINYAVMDAVATANLLGERLKAGKLSEQDLARVQHRRELPTRVIQAMVNLMQNTMVKAALDPQRVVSVPFFIEWPGLRSLAARLIGYGIRPEHVKGVRRSSQVSTNTGKWVGASLTGLGLILIVRGVLRRFSGKVKRP